MAAAALVAAAALTGVALDRYGKSSRTYGEPRAVADRPSIRVARNASEAIDIWRASGLRGRVLVHLGHYLHFVEPDDEYGARAVDRFPYGIEGRVLAHAGDPAMLWVLMRINVARELVNVLPPEIYSEKVGAEAVAQGAAGTRRTVDDAFGLERAIVDYLPRFDEPVLLSIDASMFATPSGRELVAALRTSPLVTDQVVVNLAEDNPRVGAGDRRLAQELADSLLSGTAAAP